MHCSSEKSSCIAIFKIPIDFHTACLFLIANYCYDGNARPFFKNFVFEVKENVLVTGKILTPVSVCLPFVITSLGKIQRLLFCGLV